LCSGLGVAGRVVALHNGVPGTPRWGLVLRVLGTLIRTRSLSLSRSLSRSLPRSLGGPSEIGKKLRAAGVFPWFSAIV
jgi:hypothetical protein